MRLKKLGSVLLWAAGLFSMPAMASSHYAWTDSGHCNEVASNGSVVRELPVTNCRQNPGSHYAWTKFGGCSEVASNGSVVRDVSVNICRNLPESINPTVAVREVTTPSRHQEAMHSELIGKRTRVDVKVEITERPEHSSHYAAQ